MIKFTKEEKNLCRKIAKKHRKEIEYGDWYYTTEYPEEKYRARIYKYRWTGMADRTINKRKDIIPLWTISDCLDFLENKVGNPELWKGGRSLKWYCRTEYSNFQEGKTPLEACLKAVLAVLEEI